MSRPATALAAANGGNGWLARRPGPVQLIDDALLIVRRATLGQLLRGWLASLPCACIALLFYYCERVEGLRTPRLAFAALLVLGFWLRFYVLAALAREFVRVLRPSLPLAAAQPAWAHMACSASISALGLWLWGWPLLVLGRLSIFATLGLLPLLALRGAIAPSYLARAACGDERGWSAFARAVEDTRGARGPMLSVELLLSGGFLLLFANLYAFGALLLVLANSVLGLDVAFVSAFVSPDNEFVPLLLLGLTLVLLEPLRAAASALAFSEARGRNEGADLHAAIDALVRERTSRSSDRAIKLGAALLIALSVWAGLGTRGLASKVASQADVASLGAPDAADEEVRVRAQHILARGEFHEFQADEHAGTQLMDWLERWLGHKSDPEPLPASSARFELLLPPWAVVLSSLVLLALVAVYLAAETRKATVPPSAAGTTQPSAISLPPHAKPSDLLADAATLARAGQHRDAVRVLYTASLVALDRLTLIRFEPSRTNGHYVRALPAGAAREQLAAFTQAFESGWYGATPVTQHDYECAKTWADALCQSPERET